VLVTGMYRLLSGRLESVIKKSTAVKQKTSRLTIVGRTAQLRPNESAVIYLFIIIIIIYLP